LELAFRKVAKEGSDFSFKNENVRFFGKVFLKSSNKVFLKAKLEGEIEHICDRCAEDITLQINEPIEIIISDGIYKGETGDLDVVETEGGVVNFDEILESEIESYKSDYHYCDKCKSQ
jgi:uncharacterized metal-binding protein YceD (DUF177 family)